MNYKDITNYIHISVKPDDIDTPRATFYLSKDCKKAWIKIGSITWTPVKLGKGASPFFNRTMERIFEFYKENNNYDLFIVNNLDGCCQHCTVLYLDKETGKSVEKKLF